MTADGKRRGPVRVLIADDSDLSRLVLRELLSADPEIEVVGTAASGADAVELTLELRPDIVTMDLHMPDLDGIASTQRIMKERPTPVLIVTSSDFWQRKDDVFGAFKYGVVDVIEKPSSTENSRQAQVLIEKVKVLSRVRVSGTIWPRLSQAPRPQLTVSPPATDRAILAIGASTGGPKAVHQVLAALPQDFDLPIVVAQHMSASFVDGFAHWLGTNLALKVRVAKPFDRPVPGTVLVAPGGTSMVLDKRGVVRTTDEPAPQSVQPSVDLLFSSVARAHGAGTIAVVLTGIGKDGQQGMADVKEAGGITLIQDEESCVVFGMPGAALAAGVVDEVVPIDRLGERIGELLRLSARP
ncbi:MAG: chemotaxis-specific protein-glutamate methyltransferase CheB [Deltaproteobacteria bacterium]|nr:chemotaxis-specific protein-glutamate methyltransferase CheB [Deltaproteobacteria bacterium]MBW2530235.1 chemotaxis-specific protein-glutamate methyltransferase CheB [Deltaproteobacteria bacterium]